MTRQLGRTGFATTTLGLGGQGSLQWTPAGVDPVEIIVKAVEQGINYLDTSNVYGPSQTNYGKAFRALNLVPGLPGYDAKKRESLFLASKTMVRYAKGSDPAVRDRTEGPAGSKVVDDVRRSLSQIFGDGQGSYPQGAYLNLFQVHNLNTIAEVDAIYTGLYDPDPKAEQIGALAALVDLRDGTNRTGLNPREEKLIRHIGISGHISSPVMIECLQRDNQDVIETMLIAINANDRRYLSHQYNAIQVAETKNLGIIAMKVFADGAMYTKEPHWTRGPEEVVQTVGMPDLPSRPLIEYSLSISGISTAIIGIGHVDKDDKHCQLIQNLSAAQVKPRAMTLKDREEVETLAHRAREGKTNWFQLEQQPLGAPRDPAAKVENWDGKPTVEVSWHMAYAADQPVDHYEVRRDAKPIGQVRHLPQTTKKPFRFQDEETNGRNHSYQIVTVDRAGRRAPSAEIVVKLV